MGGLGQKLLTYWLFRTSVNYNLIFPLYSGL